MTVITRATGEKVETSPLSLTIWNKMRDPSIWAIHTHFQSVGPFSIVDGLRIHEVDEDLKTQTGKE